MIEFNQFQNGQSKGKHDQGGFFSMVNVDIHTEPGQISAQYALEEEVSANHPDETSVQAITPAGSIYYFSSGSGKIWKRNSSGVFSVITANSNTVGHRGARYYNGKVYYWTVSKLGVFVADTEASRNDNLGTFSNSSAYGGNCEENLTLFITDGKYVATVNSSGTFSANALDIPVQFIGSCLIPDGNTNILLGTIISNNLHECRVFLWDTYSDSFTLSDLIPERGVNTFINCDDIILIQCGIYGHIYQWTGGQAISWDNFLNGETTTVGHQLSCNYNGKPLLAAGNRIYSIYRKVSGLPRALVREYTAAGNITSLEVFGSYLSVSRADGLDKISSSKADAYVETPEIRSNADNVIVDYSAGGGDISIDVVIDGEAYATKTAINDSISKRVYFDGGLGQINFLQARINFTGDAVITNIKME